MGDVLNLKDGETWKVVKLTSNGGVLAAPFGKTKDSYISIAIEFPAHILKNEVVSLNEAKSSIKVGDIVQKSYASTDEDYIKEFEVVSIDKNGKAILKDTKTGKLTGMYVGDLHKVSMNEATKDEETKFHKKLDKLVHDTFGKRKGELEEVNLKQSKLSSSEYQKAKKLKDFKASDWKWNADEDLYIKVNEGELTEAKSFTIDSESASDSDKITDFLTQNNISFKKVGSKIKISLDRDTPKASVILSKLNKLAKFDELNEASDYFKRRKAMDDYAVSKQDKPKKPYNPTPSGKTDYMKRREAEKGFLFLDF